jgi:hypothetical protein
VDSQDSVSTTPKVGFAITRNVPPGREYVVGNLCVGAGSVNVLRGEGL